MKIIHLLLGLIRTFQVFVVLMLTGAVLLLWLSDGQPVLYLENPKVVVPSHLKGSLGEALQSDSSATAPFSVHARHLDIGLHQSSQSRVVGVLFVIMVMGFIYAFLEILHRIILSVRLGKAFELANIRRIRWIGQGFLVAFLVERLVLWGLSFYIESELKGFQVTSTPSMGWMSLILGLSLLAIGLAFAQARQFQEDSELTV